MTIELHPEQPLDARLEALNRDTTAEADARAAAGRRFSLAAMLFAPPAAFCGQYLARGGWRDGTRGLASAGLSAMRALALQGKLLERSRG